MLSFLIAKYYGLFLGRKVGYPDKQKEDKESQLCSPHQQIRTVMTLLATLQACSNELCL